MPWNGSGTYVPPITFVDDTPATAEDQNTQDTDIAGGITNCLARDGQNAAAANISLGGNKLINVGAGSASTDGANFSQLGALLPAGIVMPTAGSTVPAGYLLCNGQAVSRTTFANLFAAIGTTYGTGDGVSTMNVPNLIGRVIAGVDPTGTVLNTFTINTPATPGGIGGVQAFVMSQAQLAAHSHSAFVSDPTHNHSINDPGHVHVFSETVQGTGAAPGSTGFNVSGTGTAITNPAITGVSNNAAGTGISVGIGNTGSSAGISIVQPTMVMNYLIKT